MYKLTPQKLSEITGGTYVGSDDVRNTPVTCAVRDNREVKRGSMFVCIQGERTDGHLYANEAFKAGASCCLAERDIPDAKGPYILVDSTLESIKTIAAYHRQQFNIPVIGITGSVGKTTAKEMIAAMLGAKLCVLKTEKNLNNELGVPLTLLSLNSEHEVAVVEMGISDFGEMSRLAQMVLPDIFVITNIGYSHTNELGDLNGVLRAKTEAFSYMSPDSIAVLNGDDELLKTYDPKIRKVTFGLGDTNDYRAINIKQKGTNAVVMDIHSDTGNLTVEIPAYGSHLSSLAPAAVVVGHLLKLDNDDITAGLRNYSNIEGRSNVSYANGITIIDDCYNANPSSVKAALVSLSELPGRRVAVLGDMLNLGNKSEQLHWDIGSEAARLDIDLLLCCGNDARFIGEGFKSAGSKESFYFEQIDDLKNSLPNYIKKGDAVLVKASRGMHFEKLLPGNKS